MEEGKFWAVAFAAMVLYGLMVWASYAIPVGMGFDSAYPRLRDYLTVTTETFVWVPSFLAGLLARRRAVLLGILTVVGGTLCAFIFRTADTITTPLLTEMTWHAPILRPYAELLNIALSVVSSFAGQNVVFRSRSRSVTKTTRLNDKC